MTEHRGEYVFYGVFCPACYREIGVREVDFGKRRPCPYEDCRRVLRTVCDFDGEAVVELVTVGIEDPEDPWDAAFRLDDDSFKNEGEE